MKKSEQIWVVNFVCDDVPEAMLFKGNLRKVLKAAHEALAGPHMDSDQSAKALGLTTIDAFVEYWSEGISGEIHVRKQKVWSV